MSANQPGNTESTRPPLVLGSDQARRLTALADGALARIPDIAGRLLEELERAQIVPDTDVPDDVVGMGSEVVFLDESASRERRVTLAYPAEANIDAGRISILTPVGTGLIGLRVGQWIDWPIGDGSVRRLRIVSVNR